ncbi:hypothetical protein Tco_0401745 [Tanacetum coccineum]
MSDSEDSTVTYTTVSSPFEDLSDIGSLGFDGLPMMLEDPYVEAAFQAPPSPDYVSGPEYPPSPEFVLEPVYSKFMLPEDEVFLAEEQPLPAAVSPTNDSPGYIADSDPEEDEEDPERILRRTPLIILPTEETMTMMMMSHPMTMRMMMMILRRTRMRRRRRSTQLRPTLSHHLYTIPSPPLLVSSRAPISPPPLPASPTYPLGFRATRIRQRAELPSIFHSLPLPPPIILSHTRASVAMMRAAAPSTYILASRSETPPLLPIPLPTPLPPLPLPSTDHRTEMLEVCLPPRKRLCIALGPRYKVGESSSAPTARPSGGFRADYAFVAALDDEIRQDTYEIYVRLDDAQDDRLLMSGRLNKLHRDRHALARTALLMEREARLSREAYGRLMDASNIAHSEVRAMRTTVLAQQIEIASL